MQSIKKNGVEFLSDEEEFTIFWQWPDAVVDNEFEFVDLTAYGIKHRSYSVVICYCLGMFVLYLVGHLTG